MRQRALYVLPVKLDFWLQSPCPEKIRMEYTRRNRFCAAKPSLWVLLDKDEVFIKHHFRHKNPCQCFLSLASWERRLLFLGLFAAALCRSQ
jgi:hypothetical protein